MHALEHDDSVPDMHVFSSVETAPERRIESLVPLVMDRTEFLPFQADQYHAGFDQLLRESEEITFRPESLLLVRRLVILPSAQILEHLVQETREILRFPRRAGEDEVSQTPLVEDLV